MAEPGRHDGSAAGFCAAARMPPAVILLHKFGADRSYELNLGVKLNESTNYTVLMPDLRGHGEGPMVETSTFGQHEADDTLAAVEYLRNLKTQDGSSFGWKQDGSVWNRARSTGRAQSCF